MGVINFRVQASPFPKSWLRPWPTQGSWPAFYLLITCLCICDLPLGLSSPLSLPPSPMHLLQLLFSVNDCPTILSGDNTRATAVSREDLPVPGSRCFLLHNLLTPEECLHYIEETERVGYSDLSQLFSSNYRSNDRVLSLCQPLVDCLWERIQPHLTRREVIRVRPIGFGNQGTWKPFRLNECCKFGRYRFVAAVHGYRPVQGLIVS